SPGIAPTVGTKWSNLFKVLNLSRNAFTWTLYALAQEGKARILSRPRLACQSGKEEELLVGGEKPVFTTEVASTTGTSGTDVEYKEYGIKVKIKPTITEDRRIKLALNAEISEVGTAEFIGATADRTAQAYPLTKRNVSTELYLNDGQTMAIGGLIKQKSEEDISKTPGLGDIPILGMFFRKRQTKAGGGSGERGNVELFITLTPTIVPKEIPAVKAAPPEKISLPKAVSGEIEAKPTLIDYAKLVQAKIFKAIYYPKPAKDAGWEGIVKMDLNISSSGQLKEVKITQSSGYKVLDDAAQEVAGKQAPYPPFPPQIDSQELWVEVPIVYKKN
ncbi:MAG: TonB family protein, partial [Candidatus Omnitrophica bacterium]|nr:TonB family protein [Candidatus Omnitrophota bacterium]